MPKRSVAEVEVTERGLVGDVNRYRFAKKDGDPDMAVLVLTLEDLDVLQGRGHDLGPGDIGENILLAGVREEQLRPGVDLVVGEVRLQISRICDPCETLSQLPQVGREGLPALLKDSMGHRGWYARVSSPGVVRLGDQVALE